MGNLIRAQTLQGYADLVGRLGGDAAALLARYRIAPILLDDPDGFLPFRHLSELLETSAELLDCPDFGLRLAAEQGIDILGAIAVVARNEASIAQGLQAIASFLPLHSPALRMSFAAPERDRVRLDFEVLEPRLAQARQVTEMVLGIAHHALQILGGPAACAAAVSFPHARLCPDKRYRDFFGCRVQFNQPAAGMLLPLALLAQPITTADSATHRFARQYLEAQAAPGTSPVGEQVSRLIHRLLPVGQCTLEAVAGQLCMSVRTLQRRLEGEGLQFDELVDQERRDLAAHYVKNSRMPLGQITGLLGYTEQSTFVRAFRRWFGTTPRAFRAGAAPGE